MTMAHTWASIFFTTNGKDLRGKIVIWLRRISSFNVVLCFIRCIYSGQIIATSSDLTPKGSWGSEISLFQGNLGWWNNIIWPDIIVSVHTTYNLYVLCTIPLIPGYIILAITSGSLKKGDSTRYLPGRPLGVSLMFYPTCRGETQTE